MSSAAIRGTVHPAKCAEVGMVQYGLPSMVQWFNNGSIWFNIGIYPVLSDLTTGHLPSDKTGYSLVTFLGPFQSGYGTYANIFRQDFGDAKPS